MKYVPIRTATIRPKTKLTFDVFVFFKESYVKYRSVEEILADDVLDKMKKKKVKKLFIPEEQESLYLKYLDASLDQLKEKSAPLEAKADFAQDTLRQEADNVQKTLESEESYRSAESRIQKVVDFMLEEPKALAAMLATAGLSVDDSTHGSTVSSLVLGVGTTAKWFGRDELTDLAVAGLLHDSALTGLGFDAKTATEKLNKEEMGKYKKHPQMAMESVAGKKFITPRVMRIISDHEEFGDGLGFPEKKRFKKLGNDSQVFNVCDAFDHFCLQQEKTAKECIETFIEKRADHFSIDIIEILEKQVRA
jgi:HD-GYP domain-containing protein (c-di-GMP phosphodiesterase class II)